MSNDMALAWALVAWFAVAGNGVIADGLPRRSVLDVTDCVAPLAACVADALAGIPAQIKCPQSVHVHSSLQPVFALGTDPAGCK